MGRTIGEVLGDLQKLKTKEEAAKYLIKGLQQTDTFWVDIKYISGYLGNEERNRIMELFDVE